DLHRCPTRRSSDLKQNQPIIGDDRLSQRASEEIFRRAAPARRREDLSRLPGYGFISRLTAAVPHGRSSPCGFRTLSAFPAIYGTPIGGFLPFLLSRRLQG